MLTKTFKIEKLFKLFFLKKFSDAQKPSPFSEDYLRNILRTAEGERYEESKNKSTNETEKTEIKIKSKPLKNQSIIVNHKVKFIGPTEDGIVETSFGNLKIPAHYFKKMNGKISNIYYLENDTKANFIRKVYKEDRNALFIFRPRTNYHNIRNLIESFSKRIAEFYFPEENIRKNIEVEKLTKKEAAEIYNGTIRKLIDMRGFLNRICVIVNNDFSLRNDETPDIQDALKRYINTFGIISESELESSSVFKYDMIIPLTAVMKAHSVKNIEEVGIQIDYLYNVFDSDLKDHKKELFNPRIFKNEQHLNPDKAFSADFMESSEVKKKEHENIVSKNRLFPLIGTFPPTNRVLYKFIFNKMKDKVTFLKLKRHVLDIGVGTGILPIIFRTSVQSTKQQFYGIDKHPAAIECAKRNCTLQNIDLKTALVDISQIKFESPVKFGENFPEKFDFIICNPPWLTARTVDLYDTGNYDPKEEFLQSLFRTIPLILEQTGVFWLVYSDISEIFGLQEKGRIYQLCQKNGLFVKVESICNADLVEKTIKTEIDVIKRKSKYIVYEITL